MSARALTIVKIPGEDRIADMAELFSKTKREAFLHLVGEIEMAMAAVLFETPAKLGKIVHGHHDNRFMIKMLRDGIRTCMAYAD
jgi:hypothetical protein